MATTPTVLAEIPDLEDLMTADLLDFILKKLISVTDYIRFGAVCRRWRSVALEQKEHRRRTYSSYRHQPPLLILPYDNSGGIHRKVYNYCDNKIYSDRISIPLAYRNRQFYSGSFFGWLAFAEDDFAITLINPCVNTPPIRLPPVMLIPEYFVESYDYIRQECLIHKVFISSDPLLDPLNYVVAAIFQHEEGYGAFIRCGEKRWTGINKCFKDITDIMFSNGRLFAIDKAHQLISIDYNSGALETSVAEEMHILTADIAVMKYVVCGGDFRYSNMCYIVDMGNGELLHAHRHFLRDEDDELDERLLTEWFKLYKLQNSNWVEIQSIGDFVLFLGPNSSIFTSSTPYLRPNCIYYTDDIFSRNIYDPQTPDMGVFDIETKTIDKLCVLPPDYPTCYRPPPIWISQPIL